MARFSSLTEAVWMGRTSLAAFLACALTIVGAPVAQADVFSSLDGGLPAPSGQYLVKFVAGASEEDQAAALADAGATDLSYVAPLRLHAVLFAADDAQAAVDQLGANPSVARVEVEQTREASAVPSDPGFSSQWSLSRIGWDELYGSLSPAGSSTVAVLDTGVDGGHVDLAGNVVPGTSILDPGSNGTSDSNGHGTEMAGIVAASTDNGEGIAGIGYAGVKVMPVTVLDAQGVGQDGDIVGGVIWAADHGADVILMSFSSPDFSPSLQEAIDYAWSKGAVLVGAAGNDGSSSAHFPAGDRGVVGVANTDEGDALSASSNYGDAAFLAAPGTGIYTTAAGGGYTTVTGTSASAAEVAAAAGLLRASSPGASNGTIVGRMARSADPLATGGAGNGRLNLARAARDLSPDELQPAGAAPVGEGGPFIGPYTAAAAVTSKVVVGAWNDVNTWTPAARTGTITSSTGSTTVTGSGTSFTTEVVAGDVLYRNDGTTQIGTVLSVTNNTRLTLTANAANNNAGVTFTVAHVPVAGDTVSITGGANVTVPFGYAAAASSVTLNPSGAAASTTLALATGTTASLTVSGDVRLNRPGGNANTTLSTNAGSVTIGGNLTLDGAATNGNRVNTVTLAANGSLTIAGNLNFVSGSTGSNLIDMGGGGTVHLAGAFNVNGTTAVGTVVPGSGTFDFNGISAQTIPISVSGVVYNNLHTNNTSAGGATPTAPISATSVTGNLRVQSGTFNNAGTNIVGGSGDTFEVANGARFNVSGTSNPPTGFTNRVYGDTSTVDFNGTSQAITGESYGHLVLSGTGAKGAAAPFTVRGDWTLGSGATYSPGGSLVTFGGGAATQTISGPTQTNFGNLTINKSAGEVVLARDTQVDGVLTFTSGNVNTGANTLIATNPTVTHTSGHVVGKLRRPIPAGGTPSVRFDVGSGANYTPATLNFTNVTSGAGTVTASTTATDHPNIATSGIDTSKSVNRYWTLTAGGGLAFTSYAPTFTFVNPGDIDAGASTGSFVVKRFDGTNWNATTAGTRTATSTQATGVTAMSDFAVGEGDLTGPVTSSLTVVPTPTKTGPTVSAQVSDSTTGGNNVTAAEYFIDVAGSAGTGTAMNATDASFNSPTENVNKVLGSDFTPLSDGQHTVYIRGRDAGGNWGAINSVNFVKDTTGPTTAITFPADGGTYNTAGWNAGCSLPGICGTASDPSGFSNALVSIQRHSDNKWWTGFTWVTNVEVFEPANVGPPNWRYNLATSALTDGDSYTIHAKATDAVSNIGPVASASFTYDTTAPTVTVEQAAGQDDPTNAQPIHFTATFSEPVTGFAANDVTVGGTAGHAAPTVNITPGLGNSYDIAVSGLSSDGTVTASIAASRVQDAATNGNTASSSVDNQVTLDQTKPQSEADSPAFSNASVTTIPVDYTASDNPGGTGLKKVELWAKKDAGAWALVDTDNAPSISGTFTYTPSGDGTYRYYTIAVDNVGNREDVPTAADHVTIVEDSKTLRDTVAPAPTLSAPPAFTNDDTPAIAGTAGTHAEDGSHSADDDHVTVRVFNGTTLLQTHTNVPVNATTGEFSVDATHLADGVYTARVDQSDAAGNSGFDERAFEVDTIKPDVTVDQKPGQADPTNDQPIQFMVHFSEAVTGFDESDVTLGGSSGHGSASVVVTGSGNLYNVAVSGLTADGTLTAVVHADKASEAAGNGNNASTSDDNEVTFDTTPPDVTVEQAAGQDDPTNAQPIHFTATFSEPVAGFDESDVTLGGSAGRGSATVSVTPGTGNTYDIAVDGLDSDGTVTADIGVNATEDAAQNGNNASTSDDNEVTYDATKPDLTVEQAAGQDDPTNDQPINYTAKFSEPVTGFDETDVTLGGTPGIGASATVTVTGGGDTYNIAVDGLDTDGTLTASVAAGKASDAAGNANNASTSDDNFVTYDTTNPDLTVEQKLGQADPTNDQPIQFTADFSEPVSGFDESDVTLAGSAGLDHAVVTVTGSGHLYNIAVSGLESDGTVTASVDAGKAADGAGNGNHASTSNDNEVTFDTTSPDVTVEQAAGQDDPTNTQPIHFTAQFTEPVIGFDGSDVALSGSAGHGSAAVTVTAGLANSYDIAVSGLDSDGTISADIGVNAAEDAAQNGNTESASDDNTVTLDTAKPESEASSPEFSNATATLIRVDYTASDNAGGTGLKKVELWAKKDGGSWELFETDNSPGVTGHFDYTPSGDGTYRFYTIAVDQAGNSETVPLESDAIVVKADTKTLRDTVAPDPTLTAPPSITNDPTPAVAGTAGTQAEDGSHSADDDHVTITILQGTTEVQAPTSVDVASDGSFSVDADHLGDGHYTARVEQSDAAGNSGFDERDFEVDTVKPDVTVQQAAGQDDPANTQPIHFTAEFSEHVSGFDESDVNLGGSSGHGSATVTVTPGPGDTYDIAVHGLDSDGVLTASVGADSAQDAAGNGNTASSSFDNEVSYDATEPDVTVEQAAGQDDPTNAQPIHFTADFSEHVSGFSADDVTLGGTAGHASATVTLTAGADDTYDIAVDGLDSDGTVTASIAADSAEDAAGNGNTASSSFDNQVRLDRSKPQSEASAPATTNTTAATFEVTYHATDTGSGLAKVELYASKDGGGYSLANTDSTPVEDGSFDFEHDGDGTYRFYTIATDNAGNVEKAPTAADDVTIVEDAKTLRDSVAPTVSLTAPPSITGDDTPAVAGTAGTQAADASHAADDDHVSVEVLASDDSVVQTHSNVPVDSGDGSFSVDATHLADGDYKARATQADGADNHGSDTRAFTVDTGTPSAPTINTGPDDPTNSTSAAFTFTPDEPGGTLECKLDLGAYEECDSRTAQSYDSLPEGAHHFYVRQVDAAGNQSDPDTFDWYVDLTAPDTQIDSGPDDPSNDTTPTFEFSGTDNHSAAADLALECNVDSHGWNPCDSPKTLAALSDSSHTFEVRATDEAGNTDASPAGSTWTIDTAGPDAPTITNGPGHLTKSSSASFEWTGAEAGGTFECKVGAAAFAYCSSPEPYGSLTEGHHKFSVRQVDDAGNNGAITEYEWDVDQTNPNTAIDAHPSNPDIDSTPDFTFSGTDNFSTPAHLSFQCNVDSLGWNACNSPKTLAALSDGSHTFDVRAIDEAGNTDASPASYMWTIDSHAPDAPAITSPADNSFNNTGNVTVQGTAENGATIEVFDGSASVGSTTAAGGNWSKALTGVADGSHTYTAKASDAAHNTSGASNSRTVVVDKVKPQSQASAPSTSSSTSIAVTYTASDDRSGLSKVELYAKPPAASSFSLAGTDTTPNTTQSFSYTAAAGDGSYAFYTRAYDNAGNVEDAPATPDATTTVTTAPPPPTFTFTGFFKPLDNLPVLNEAKAGSAIPVKFSLGGNKGLNIFAPDYPKSQAVPCNSTAPVDGIETLANPGASTLSYDSASQTYTYVWKTEKSLVGCRQLVVKFIDGSYARAEVKFK